MTDGAPHVTQTRQNVMLASGFAISYWVLYLDH